MIAKSMWDGGVVDDTEVHRALAHERRRHVLSVLRNTANPLPLTVLARRVAELEADDDADVPTDDALQQYRISLFHTHLPQLADVGLVDFDTEGRVAALAPDVQLDA